jgi:hypothetical protein
MTIVFNMSIALVIAVAMGLGALHYYPAYEPSTSTGWIGFFAFGTLLIIVAEAIVDSAGLCKTWPKTQRLIVIAIIVSGACIAALPYVERIR